MATILEEFNLLKAKILADKGNEVIHIVWSDQDRKRKRSNKGPKQQTRFSINCDSPEAFSELYTEYDRILTQVGNKTIALSIIIAWLRALDSKRIKKKLEEGQQQALPAYLRD